MKPPQRSPETILRELRLARYQLLRHAKPRQRRAIELRRDALALELALSQPSVLRIGPL